MSKSPKKKRKKSNIIPVAIIVAIVTGIFSLFVTIITAGPNWIAVLRTTSVSSISATPQPTRPPLPIINSTLPPTPAIAPIRFSNFLVGGDDNYFPASMTAGEATTLQREQTTPSSTGSIGFVFTATSLAPSEEVKIDNYVLFQITRVETLPEHERQNILLPPPPGGGGSYTDFALYVDGPIQEGDVLKSQPAPEADFFTLKPGELMVFRISSDWNIPPGRYLISVGVIYEYQGNVTSQWIDKTVEIISPVNPVFWYYEKDGWMSRPGK